MERFGDSLVPWNYQREELLSAFHSCKEVISFRWCT